jgi:hypothetical protein
MASITFTTTLGTSVSIDGPFKSQSSFEIIKSAMAIVEAIELAEANEQDPEQIPVVQMLHDGMYSPMLNGVGPLTGLVLTSRPDHIVFMDQPASEYTATVQDIEPTEGDESDEVEEYSPAEDFEDLVEELIGERLVELILESVSVAAGHKEFRQALVNLNEEALGPVDLTLNKFFDMIPTFNETAFIGGMGILGTQIKEYSAILKANPAQGAVYGIGVGLTLAAAMTEFFNDTPDPELN